MDATEFAEVEAKITCVISRLKQNDESEFGMTVIGLMQDLLTHVRSLRKKDEARVALMKEAFDLMDAKDAYEFVMENPPDKY